MFCQQLNFGGESFVEYVLLGWWSRKVLGYTLYNQRLMNILNKISFHIFASHVKKDPKGKGKMKDAYIPNCFIILNDFYRC